MQTIIVDMTPGFRMPTIYYSQGDVGTQFAIDLRSRFGDTLPESATVTIQATKPSGFGFSVAATSVTNGVATFTTTAEMTDEFGRFPAELKVTKTGLTLFTANFYMDGERNTHPEGTTDGSQETVIPELTQLVERVEDAASSVLDMTVEAETLAAGSQATYSYDEDTNTATFGIPQGEAGAGAAGVVASAYSSSSTYAVGDYVIHNSNLYRCTTAITTAEAWTSGHWTQVALAPEVSDLKSNFNQYNTNVFLLESGTFADADGATKTVSNRRVRNKYRIAIKDIKKITAPSGYNLWWFALGESGSLLQTTSGWVNQIEISALPSGTVYINFAIRNQSTPTSDISSQVSTIQAGLIVERISDYANETATKALSTIEKRVTPINLFNGTAHDGIQSQTSGDSYGKITASDSYFYTDLIDIPDKLFVFSNFYGGTTVYVTFFNSAGVVVGSSNGNNPFITLFPVNAVKFCVCAGKSTLDTLIISDTLPTYYTKNKYIVEADNKAPKKYKRIDRGIVSGYYPSRQSVGQSVYALSASENLVTSYPVPVEDIENISYRNNSNVYPACMFFDDSANVVSIVSLLPNSSGTITVPEDAIGFIWFSSALNADTEICFVYGSTPPNEIYGFNDIEIEGLNINDNSWNHLFGKKILFTGDSITQGSNYNGGWVTLIQNKYNCTCTNEGHNGWTICPLPNRTDNLMTLLASLSGNYDIVALSGGYNDFTVASPAQLGTITPYTYSALDTSTFCGAIEQYLRTAKTKWKTAKIGYVLTMKREYNDASYNTLQQTYWNIIREACKKYAIPLLDLYYESALVGVTVNGITDELTEYFYMNGDGTHPNQEGYNFLYEKIAKFLTAL